MSLSDCQPCCTTPLSAAVPGPQGASGVTTTTTPVGNFTIPAIGSTVVVSFGSISNFMIGDNVFIGDGSKFGNFIIVAPLVSAAAVTLRFLGMVGDSAAGQVIVSGALVAQGPGNYTVPWDMDSFTAFTDNSGGTKSDTIAATVAKSTVIMPIGLVGITGNGLQLAMVIPFNFTVTSVLFRIAKVVTAGAKLATLTTQVNGASVTGGVVNLTSANCTPYGATVAGSAITGANSSSAAGQTVGFISSAVTPFTEGDGWLEFTITNLDWTAYIAAIADKINTLRTRLRHA